MSAAPAPPQNKRRAGAKTPPPPPRPLWLYIVAGVMLLFALLGMILGGTYLHFLSSPVLAQGERKTFVIPHDTPWPGVVKILRMERLVRSRWSFELWARRRGLPSKVRAGVYSWTGPVSLAQLEERLAKGGQTQDVSVTIPEGWTIYHVADRLEAVGLMSRAAFLDAACDEALLHELDIPGECAEGYLFPDTYRVAQGTSAQQLVRKLHARFVQVFDQVKTEHRDALQAIKDSHDLSPHDVVILASLIERETNYDPERAIIGRVFLNRLDKKMRLQTDPTCVYGPLTYKEIPHPKYCKDKLNRYSTYIIDGLPPGPIGAPGLASLEAALNPATDAKALKYLYFVAKRDGSGAHTFSETFGAHKRAIDRHLR